MLDGLYPIAFSDIAGATKCPQILLKSLAVLRERQEVINVQLAARIGCGTVAAKHALEVVTDEHVVSEAERNLALVFWLEIRVSRGNFKYRLVLKWLCVLCQI